MTKRAVSIVVAIMLLVSLSSVSPALAKGSVKTQKVLKPAKGSEVVLDKVEYVEDGNGATVNIKDGFGGGETLEAFNIKVDGKAGTYKTTKIAPINEQNGISTGDNVITASTVARYNWVRLETDDPVSYPLCSTRLYLDWYDYGGTLAYRGHSIQPWAANPSGAGTHWYTSSYWIGDPYIYFANSRLDQSGNGKYYNWDFQNSSLRTDVAHYITITCYAGGYAERTISWSRSGEYWWLLDLDVYSGSGVY